MFRSLYKAPSPNFWSHDYLGIESNVNLEKEKNIEDENIDVGV